MATPFIHFGIKKGLHAWEEYSSEKKVMKRRTNC